MHIEIFGSQRAVKQGVQLLHEITIHVEQGCAYLDDLLMVMKEIVFKESCSLSSCLRPRYSIISLFYRLVHGALEVTIEASVSLNVFLHIKHIN